MPIPVVNAVLRLWGRLVKEGLHAWYTLVRPAFAAGVTSPGPPGEPLATGAVLRLAVGQALHGPELDAKAAEAKGVTHPTKPPVSWAVLTRWGFTRDYQVRGPRNAGRRRCCSGTATDVADSNPFFPDARSGRGLGRTRRDR